MEQSLPKKDNQTDDILNAPSSTFLIDFNNPHSHVIIDFAKKVLEICNVFNGNEVRFEIVDSKNSFNKIPVEVVSVNDPNKKFSSPSYKGRSACRVGHASRTVQIFKEKIDLMPNDLAKMQCIIWGYFFAINIKTRPESVSYLIADKSTLHSLMYNKFLEDKESLSEFFNNYKEMLLPEAEQSTQRLLHLESLIFKNEDHG